MNNGYSLCLNEWALDKDIKNELNLLLIISSLTAEKGYCYASNKYFAELFDTNEVSISRKIKKLEEKKYIKIEYKMNGNAIKSREIRLTKMLMAVNKNVNGAVNKNVKDNNISSNNNINNKNIYSDCEKFYKEEFDRFWRAYPRKDSRSKAKEKFIKLKPDKELVDLMIKQIERFKNTDSWKKDNGQFIPYAITWLNGRRWEDEVEIKEEPKKEKSKILHIANGYYLDSDNFILGKVGEMDVSNYEVR